MSRFMLDCAVARPVDAETAQWVGMAANRAWASPTGGYHEAKVSAALLQEAGRSISEAVGATTTAFLPEVTTAVSYAVSDVALRGSYSTVATSAADPVLLQEATQAVAGHLGLAHQIVEVDPRGRVGALPERTVLVTSLVNQEIGVVQRDVRGWVAATGSALILEASSGFGWVDLPQADRVILDPRAWGAPAGAVAVASNAPVRAPIFENVPAAVVAGLACQRWAALAPQARVRARAQIERIATWVHDEVPDVDLHGGGPDDAPHILSLSVLYVDAEALQTRLDARGYAVGSGSACTSRSGQPSHVLAAVGALTSGNVRLGLPAELADEAVDGFMEAFSSVVAEVREEMGTASL